MMASRAGWAVVAVACGLAGTSPSEAQEGDSVGLFEIGLHGVGFVDYPSELSNGGCQQGAAGLGAEGRIWPWRWLAVEGSGMVTFHAGSTVCFEILSAPQPLDVPYFRTVYDEDLAESPSYETSVGALLEPFRGRVVSPRVRLGFGRDWSKGLDFWYVGGGLRFPFGRHAVLFDLDRRKLEIERLREEVITRSSGTTDLLSSEVETIERTPWVVRVAWSWSPGAI